MALFTDLALEAREMDPDIPGIMEETTVKYGATVTRITVETDEAARRMGKKKGSYITIDFTEITERTAGSLSCAALALADELGAMLKGRLEGGPILVVGLGNRRVTPDSIGPETAERISVTRHIMENVPELLDFSVPSVCSIAPGVMGLTGIETAEYVKALAAKLSPGAVIAIDTPVCGQACRAAAVPASSAVAEDPTEKLSALNP